MFIISATVISYCTWRKFMSCTHQYNFMGIVLYAKMYKRPIPRDRGHLNKEFVSRTLPSGAIESRWAPSNVTPVIPSGHPSRIGEIIDKMRNIKVPPAQQRCWTPSCDYEVIAKYMDNPEPFLKKCRDWFVENPIAPRAVPPPPLVINQEPIIALFDKYSRVENGPKVPPVSELEKAWRKAGYSEERIAKALAWCAKMDATSDERQKVLDTIFAKFPSANKPVPKTKTKKVIKVVKKKMPNTNNEQTTMG
jgi:hypothetical protein